MGTLVQLIMAMAIFFFSYNSQGNNSVLALVLARR